MLTITTRLALKTIDHQQHRQGVLQAPGLQALLDAVPSHNEADSTPGVRAFRL